MKKREEFIARVTRHLEVVVTSTLSRQMKAPAVVIGSGVLVPCLAHAYEVLGGHAIVDRRIVTSPPGSISVERGRSSTQEGFETAEIFSHREPTQISPNAWRAACDSADSWLRKEFSTWICRS